MPRIKSRGKKGTTRTLYQRKGPHDGQFTCSTRCGLRRKNYSVLAGRRGVFTTTMTTRRTRTWLHLAAPVWEPQLPPKKKTKTNKQNKRKKKQKPSSTMKQSSPHGCECCHTGFELFTSVLQEWTRKHGNFSLRHGTMKMLIFEGKWDPRELVQYILASFCFSCILSFIRYKPAHWSITCKFAVHFLEPCRNLFWMWMSSCFCPLRYVKPINNRNSLTYLLP